MYDIVVRNGCSWFFFKNTMLNNNKDSKPDRKEDRRQKIDKKFLYRDNLSDDDGIKNHHIKRERKKIKEELDDEEWENWDRFYNH